MTLAKVNLIPILLIIFYVPSAYSDNAITIKPHKQGISVVRKNPPINRLTIASGRIMINSVYFHYLSSAKVVNLNKIYHFHLF